MRILHHRNCIEANFADAKESIADDFPQYIFEYGQIF